MTDKVLIDRELLEQLVSDELALSRLMFGGIDGMNPHRERAANLRAALDAPQQEAVAYVITTDNTSVPSQNGSQWLAFDVAKFKENAARCLTVTSVTPLYTHPAPSVPEGWKLVPKEPTAEMREYGLGAMSADESSGQVWNAMLSAAPKAPTTDDRKDAERWRKARDADPDSGEPYLVRQRTDSWGNWRDEILLGDDADAAIDAAIAAQKGEKE